MRWSGKKAIPWLLAAATLLPIAALGWLSVRILAQDREIERQRQVESLKLAAARLALTAEAALTRMEDQAASGDGIRFAADGLGPGVLYQPGPPQPQGARDGLFDAVEALEFQVGDLAAAEREYRRLAASADPAARAEALVRLGRVLRRQDRKKAALDVYEELERLGPVAVGGQPARMIALQVKRRLSNTHEDLEEFQRALYSGEVRMDRATFELYRRMLRDWGGPGAPTADVARTEAAISLWRRWKAGSLASRGRELISTGGSGVVAVWAGGPQGGAVQLSTLDEMRQGLHASTADLGLQVSFEDGPQGDGTVVLTPGETRLPFLLRVSSEGATAAGGFASGRSALLAGLALTFALMLAAAYALYRTTTREMALAEQQTDFVAAVSHEFRTPLTSIRHLSDLLVRGRVPGEERKAQYYRLLAHEGERLHRMVESLLSFRRMQAGSPAWQMEAADVNALVEAVVEEFRRDPQWNGRQVICDVGERLPELRADREALSRALANLLENAGKYSEPQGAIRVSTRREGESVRIAVADEGAGIPPAQQKKLFDKFIRGDDARRAGVRGIGLGLALVRTVAEAHGGSVELESAAGAGSTFTLVIPCHES